MTEERENTRQIRLDASDPFPSGLPIEKAICDLLGFNEDGYLLITIEYHKEDEVEDE
jgi:hypothetical protein